MSDPRIAGEYALGTDHKPAARGRTRSHLRRGVMVGLP